VRLSRRSLDGGAAAIDPNQTPKTGDLVPEPIQVAHSVRAFHGGVLDFPLCHTGEPMEQRRG